MRKIRTSKKGFTLAELLIVVAIIGVLVGISIPIFTTQLAKSRLSTNQANARSAKAAAVAEYLAMDTPAAMTYNYDVGTGSKGTTAATESVGASNMDISGWTTANFADMSTTTYDYWTITIDANGNVTDIMYGPTT